MSRVQVITGVERRRRWSADQKRALVAAAFAPGAVVTEVARRADVNSGQIYRWREELREWRDACDGTLSFAPVVVSPEAAAVSSAPEPMIEIELGNGARVRLPSSVAPDLAAALVGALVRP
jgi:transposase